MARPYPLHGLRATVLDGGAVVLSFEVGAGASQALDAFPPAERAVIGLMLEGLSDVEIAAQRQCSRHTVSNLLRSAYRRVGVSTRAELATWLTDSSAHAPPLSERPPTKAPDRDPR